MVHLICDQHGSTTFVKFTCSDLLDDYQAGRPLRSHREIGVGFDPPIDEYPVWFSILLCDACLSDIGIPSDQTEITDKDLESTLAEKSERFYRPKIICARCFEDYLAPLTEL